MSVSQTVRYASHLFNCLEKLTLRSTASAGCSGGVCSFIGYNYTVIHMYRYTGSYQGSLTQHKAVAAVLDNYTGSHIVIQLHSYTDIKVIQVVIKVV